MAIGRISLQRAVHTPELQGGGGVAASLCGTQVRCLQTQGQNTESSPGQHICHRSLPRTVTSPKYIQPAPSWLAETLRACPSTFLCAIRLLAPHARRLSRYPWNPLYHQPSSLPVPLADRPPSSSIFYRPPTPPATSSLRSTVNCHIVPILRSLTAAVHCYVKTSIRGTGRGYFGV